MGSAFIADSFHNFLFRVQPKVSAGHSLTYVEQDCPDPIVQREAWISILSGAILYWEDEQAPRVAVPESCHGQATS
jgi:hypothetical protein